MRPPITTGRVYVRELLDVVGATDSDAATTEQLRQLYDWHNGRSVTGMQLTFAPVVAAILAIVAKPESTAVVIASGAVVLLAAGLGVAQLFALNWHHGEYVFAIRLAAELRRFHRDLARYPHANGAPPGSVAHSLYERIGSVSMVSYRADPTNREAVLSTLAELAGQLGQADTDPTENS